MDPREALISALAGDREAARAYNDWVRRDGFRASVDVDPGTDLWMMGARSLLVSRVGTKYVTGKHPMSGRTFRVALSLVTVSA